MAGMKVMCSIQESELLNLTESPVKALQGNQIPPSVDIQWMTCQKFANGMPSLLWSLLVQAIGGPDYPPLPWAPQCNADMFQKLGARYQSQHVEWRTGTPPPNNFDGDASLTYNAPQISGFPSGLGFGDEPAEIAYAYLTNYLILGLTDTDANWNDGNGSTLLMHLGAGANPVPDFMSLVSAMVAETWPAWGSSKHWRYSEYEGSGGQGLQSTVDPSPYNGAMTTDASSPFGPWGISPNSGWNMAPAGYGVIQGARCRIRYQGTAPQYYWIGRYRSAGDDWVADGYGSIEYPKPIWLYRIEFVSSGWLTPIAGVAYLDIPFVGSSPSISQSIDGGPVAQDWNFGVVGQDAAGWFQTSGFLKGFGDYYKDGSFKPIGKGASSSVPVDSAGLVSNL